MPAPNRRLFVTSAASLLVASPGLLTFGSGKLQEATNDGQKEEKKEPLTAEMVHEFVSKAHGNLDKVKKLVEEEPILVRCAWDWGNGDFESALGAAAHMGNRPIARYLIEKGAPMDLFAAAMLGHLDIVKAILATFPEMIEARGPHRIPLLAHARAGGEEAKPVVDFLLQQKGRGEEVPTVELTDEQIVVYTGSYKGTVGDREFSCNITKRDNGIFIESDGQTAKRLVPIGNHRFTAVDVDETVVFQVTDGRATGFEVEVNGQKIKGERA